jgi:hypothetical protein
VGNIGWGAANLGLGALNYVGSPINAALRAVAGKPIQDVTGIPKEYTEFAIGMASPLLGARGIKVPSYTTPPPPFFSSTVPELATRQSTGTVGSSSTAAVSAPHVAINRALFDYSSLNRMPNVPQYDLPRVAPTKNLSSQIQSAAAPTTLARIHSLANAGEQAGARALVNMEPLREAFITELGNRKGQADFERYMKLSAGATNAAEMPHSLRIGSYYYKNAAQDEPLPTFVKVGSSWRLENPPPYPYGHMAQAQHARNASQVVQTGNLDPLQNPKTASFAENLTGNLQPVTIDRHVVRTFGLTDRVGRQMDVPPRTAYGFLEDVLQKEALKRNTTPAQLGQSLFLAGGAQTGRRTPPDPTLRLFEDRLATTAQTYGLSKEEVLRRFIRGELPLLGVGAGIGVSAGDRTDSAEYSGDL